MKTVILFSILLLSYNIAVRAQTQPVFTPAPGSPFAVGTVPESVAVGDFNGDGIADLAVANSNDNNVTVLLGSASGSLTAAPGSPFAVGANPSYIVVGDFNKDGHQDLAVSNGNGSAPTVNSTITVLLGNGSGGFAAAPGGPTTVGIGGVAMAVGDFNEDGILDLVTINSISDTVIVLLGNGSGGFSVAAGSPFLLFPDAASIAVADFNRDGHLDIVMGTGSGKTGATLMLGDGKGGFTTAPGNPFPAGLNAGAVAVGDFNGDGVPDIAATNPYGGNNVAVLLGNGSGGFTASAGSPFALGTRPASIAAIDFNGDGFLDLVTANEGSNTVSVLLGNGSGTFTTATSSPLAVGADPISVAVGDFNGDGAVDIATANPASGNVTVLLGGGSGGARPAITQGGIVPVDSTTGTIQPGEWVSVYGTNLAASTATWNGDFPTSLGGATVTINGKSAYLWYASPIQINLQAPDDTTTGSVPVVVTTARGTFTSTVTLAQSAPSFLLLDTKHVTGIILRQDGSGAYGGGTYDVLGPTGNSLGYPTVAAKAGEIVALYAVGLGPTNPIVPAGQVFSGAAPTTNSVNLLINKVNVTPIFAGLSSAGLYQINLVIPANLSTGDVSLAASVGGSQTQSNVVISLQ